MITRVEIPTSILLCFRLEMGDGTQLAPRLTSVEKNCSGTYAQCLLSDIDGPLRAAERALSCFDGWLLEEDGR